MRLSIYLIRYLTRETPHTASGSSMRGRSAPRAQRGANLIESALAMSLVAIGVFATVSSFGDGTTSRISGGILPVIGGALPSESELSSPDLRSGNLRPIDDGLSTIPLVGVPGGVTNYGSDEGIGGITGNEGDGEEWNGGGDNGSVGGIDAMPPNDNRSASSADSGSWTSQDSNTLIGGIDAYPETGYQGGDSSDGSNTSAGAEAATDNYEGNSYGFEFPLDSFSSVESLNE